MKRLFAITGVMLLSTAVFLVAVSTGNDMVTKQIKGQFSGTDYSVGLCPDGRGQALTVGKGVATEFGESNLLSMYCVDCSEYPSCHSTGWMIVTAANGDAIHLEITDASIDFNTGEWLEEEDIVGGTGRFKDATGHVETKGHFVLPTDPDRFPWNTPILPSLLQEPTFWVGTSDGYIMY